MALSSVGCVVNGFLRQLNINHHANAVCNYGCTSRKENNKCCLLSKDYSAINDPTDVNKRWLLKHEFPLVTHLDATITDHTRYLWAGYIYTDLSLFQPCLVCLKNLTSASISFLLTFTFMPQGCSRSTKLIVLSDLQYLLLWLLCPLATGSRAFTSSVPSALELSPSSSMLALALFTSRLKPIFMKWLSLFYSSIQLHIWMSFCSSKTHF